MAPKPIPVLPKLESPETRWALAEILVNFTLQRPVAELISAELMVATITGRLTDEDYLSKWIDTHLRSFIQREGKRTINAKTEERIGDFIEPEFGAEVRTVITQQTTLNREQVEKALEQAVIEHLLKGIVRETLDGFVNTVRSAGKGTGVIGSVGRGALGFASRAGRNLLGQFGEQVEGQLRTAMKTFMDSSMTSLRNRVADLIMSDEVKAMLNRAVLDGYDRAHQSSTATLWSRLDSALEDDGLLDALPAQLVHLWSMPQMQKGVYREVEAWLDVEGNVTLEELMGSDASAECRRIGPGLLDGFLNNLSQHKDFHDWLTGDDNTPNGKLSSS